MLTGVARQQDEHALLLHRYEQRHGHQPRRVSEATAQAIVVEEQRPCSREGASGQPRVERAIRVSRERVQTAAEDHA